MRSRPWLEGRGKGLSGVVGKGPPPVRMNFWTGLQWGPGWPAPKIVCSLGRHAISLQRAGVPTMSQVMFQASLHP